MEENTVLAQRLKNLRTEKKLFQKDIAEKLNITTSAYGFYEQGKRTPDTDTLKALADFFKVSIDYLLGRTENKNGNAEKEALFKEIPEEFTDPDEARTYVKKHKIFASEGFDVNRLTDEEVLSFSNALLEQMRLVGYKYKK